MATNVASTTAGAGAAIRRARITRLGAVCDRRWAHKGRCRWDRREQGASDLSVLESVTHDLLAHLTVETIDRSSMRRLVSLVILANTLLRP
jgi:hypothetical protein